MPMLTDKQRLKRLEDIAVLLCQEATRGMGMLARPFDEFVDAIREEREEQGSARPAV